MFTQPRSRIRHVTWNTPQHDELQNISNRIEKEVNDWLFYCPKIACYVFINPSLDYVLISDTKGWHPVKVIEAISNQASGIANLQLDQKSGYAKITGIQGIVNSVRNSYYCDNPFLHLNNKEIFSLTLLSASAKKLYQRIGNPNTYLESLREEPRISNLIQYGILKRTKPLENNPPTQSIENNRANKKCCLL